jgi:hypothetical protein
MFIRRSVSLLIATILLIVVSVILITVVLTWSSSFAKENLNQIDLTSTFTESDLSSFLVLTDIKQLSESNLVIIRNIHSTESIKFIGYNLVTDSNYIFGNQPLYFKNEIILDPGAFVSFNLICLPESNFYLQLFNEEKTYFSILIKTNNYRSDNYCFGKNGLVADYDMTVVDNVLVDKSKNNYNLSLLTGNPETQEKGIFFSDGGFSRNHLPANSVSSVLISFKTDYSSLQTIIYGFGFSSFQSQSSIKLDASGRLSTSYSSSNEYYISESLNNNEFYTVAVLFDRSIPEIRMFVNGEEKSYLSRNPYIYVSSSFTIGQRDYSSPYFFNGVIYDIKLFADLLSEQEILDYNDLMFGKYN